MLPQGRRRMNIGVRVNTGGRAAGLFDPLGTQWAIFDLSLGLWNATRAVLSAQGDDAGRFYAVAIEVQPKRYTHHSQVTGTPGELFKSEDLVTPRPWNAYLDYHFVGRERGSEHSLDEVADLQSSFTVLALQDDATVQRQHDSRIFCRRIGMRQAAANRAARPNWKMAD